MSLMWNVIFFFMAWINFIAGSLFILFRKKKIGVVLLIFTVFIILLSVTLQVVR